MARNGVRIRLTAEVYTDEGLLPLERRPDLRPPPKQCPECGRYPEGFGPPLRYRMEFADGGPRSRWCGSCGTQLVYAMEFDRAG